MRVGTEQLRALLEPPVENLGYELVHVELSNQDKSKILRVYIDAPGGIQVDDCATVSRQLSAILDVEDPLNTAYLLEVSSPGLDRPLVKSEHFKQFVGETARIVMATPILGRRRFTGRMIEAGDEEVVLEIDGESYELPYKDMTLAHLEPVF